MKTIKKVICGDVQASLRLESLGYTYKITAHVKGSNKRETVARSYVYFKYKDDAEKRMLDDLEQVTHQLKLF